MSATATQALTTAKPTETAAGSAFRFGRGRRGRRDNHPRTKREAARYATWWWVVPALALVLAVHYGAVGAGSIYAFTDWRGIGPFNWVGFDNFVQILTNPKTQTAFFNTVVLAAMFLVLTNVFGLLLALALNRTLRSRHFLRVLLFMPVVLSPLAVSYVWKFIFQQTGPLNNLFVALGMDSWVRTWLADPDTAIWTILVVMVWQHLGLAMVIYLAGLANVPPELEEAASVDGAGSIRRFFSVVLPLLRSTVIIASTLLLIRGLSVFDQVLAMTGGGPYGATETMATLVYKETFVNGKYGYGAALSLILTLMIAVFALLQIGLLRPKKES